VSCLNHPENNPLGGKIVLTMDFVYTLKCLGGGGAVLEIKPAASCMLSQMLSH
jgi:hypothetical protein